MKKHKKLYMLSSLFGFGGALYCCIELLYRQRTHWTMFIVGGLCFVGCGLINEIISWETPLILQGLIGSAIITSVEFISGCIVNLWLGWNVWDYSNLPLNVLGQICLPFSVIWIVLGIVAIVIDDYIRYMVFDEEYPIYKLF